MAIGLEGRSWARRVWATFTKAHGSVSATRGQRGKPRPTLECAAPTSARLRQAVDRIDRAPPHSEAVGPAGGGAAESDVRRCPPRLHRVRRPGRLGSFVGVDDRLHQRMPDDVRLVEHDDPDPRHRPQPLDGVGQAADGRRRQVDLRDVAGDHDPGVLAHPGQEHLHLRDRRVLPLVEDDHRVVQRPPPHVGQRGDLDQVVAHVAADLVVVHQVVQGVEQGTEVRVDLRLEVARAGSRGARPPRPPAGPARSS